MKTRIVARAFGMLAVAVVVSSIVVAQAPAPVKTGDKVPDYTFKSLDGTVGRQSMAALRGRVVLIDFWGTN